MRKLKHNKTLSEDVYEQLLNEISLMEPGNNRLPSEETLSEMLGVSRATIREALKHLQLNGIITTIHGRGTYAHPAVLGVPNRLDVNSDFLLMLESQYEQVEIRQRWKPHMKAEGLAHSEFGEENASVLLAAWEYIADMKIRFYARFSFLETYMQETYDINVMYRSLPEFSRKCMKNEIDYCVMKSHIKYDKEAAEIFGVDEKTPLHCWNETIFDIDDNKVGVAEVFVHPENLEISIVTKFMS